MIRFGPASAGDEFIEEGFSSLLQMPKWVKERGLNAFEYSFGHGYQMKSDLAEEAGKLFKEYDIKVSIHAPYYINFAKPDPVMYEKSVGYIKTGIKFLRAFEYADHLVFHSGSCGKMDRGEAIQLVTNRFLETFEILENEGALDGLYICPEAMGKPLQIGTYKEVIDLCMTNSHLVPTFDFGHINALTHGSLKGKEDYRKIFDYCIEKLGFERTSNCHIHFSKVEYGEKGEIRHLTFEDNTFGPDYEPMLETILDLGLEPRIICESRGTQPRDALVMKKYYEKIKRQ